MMAPKGSHEFEAPYEEIELELLTQSQHKVSNELRDVSNDTDSFITKENTDHQGQQDMSGRKNTHNTSSGAPYHRLSDFTQAASNNNRSAATPASLAVSPTSNRAADQRQMDSMADSTYAHGGIGNYGSSNVNIRAPASSQFSAHNRGPSSSAHSNESQGSVSHYGETHQAQHNHGSSVSTNTSTLTVAECSQYLQASLNQLQQKVKTMPGVAGPVQDAIIDAIRDMSQSYNEKQRNLQRLWDRLQNENSQLNQQLDDARRQLKDVNQTNTETTRQRDTFQARINELLREQRKKQQEWEKAEQAYKKEIEGMKYQIASREDQLKGKRVQWMDQNPTASESRETMNTVRDPFHSPTADRKSSFGENLKKLNSNNVGGNNFGGNNFVGNFGGATSHMASTFSQALSHQAASGPPPRMDKLAIPTGPANKAEANKLRRQQAYETLPVGKALPSSQLDFSLQNTAPNMMPRTEVGSGGSEEDKAFPSVNIGFPLNTRAGSSSQTSGTRSTEDPAESYTSEFAAIYHMVEGWVKTYGNLPNLVNDQAIARSNHDLWSYMMNLTYPGKAQDSHSHVMLLLNDRKVRFWFVMRMYVSYLVWDVISIKTFYGFDLKIDQTLNEVKAGLQERGLNNERRQYLIDVQSRAVQSIVNDQKWEAFRSAQLAFHSKRLRELLGPMLNDGCAREEAGKDIGGITIRAFDLSAKMHTSHLTFQVYFPETASKFSAATMMAKDQPNIPGMQLQINQTRLKLVITPVITMRDDRGTTIKAKNLHHSTVLTMG